MDKLLELLKVIDKSSVKYFTDDKGIKTMIVSVEGVKYTIVEYLTEDVEVANTVFHRSSRAVKKEMLLEVMKTGCSQRQAGLMFGIEQRPVSRILLSSS